MVGSFSVYMGPWGPGDGGAPGVAGRGEGITPGVDAARRAAAGTVTEECESRGVGVYNGSGVARERQRLPAGCC